MLRIINILIFLFATQNLSLASTNNGKNYYFAVGVFFGPNSQIITYAVITKINGNIVGTQIMREQRFMYYILGYWPTPANPERLNLLNINGVDSCFLTSNYSNKINGYYVKPFYNLWKIRYKSHPIAYDLENGWSQEYYKPSSAQIKFLYENYGIGDIKTQYIYGDSLFKLLRDIQSPDWIVKYSILSDTL
jgi:hypothetical protein